MNNPTIYEKFEVILDSIAEGVFTVDQDWNITYFNKTAEQITGYSRDEAIGKKCYQILKSNICKNDCILKKTIESGNKIINQRLKIVNKHDQTTPLNISTAVLRDSKNKIVGGVETFRDCSDVEYFKNIAYQNYTIENIISKNKHVQEIFKIMPDIAQTSSNVLIQGPSGSGKELFAKAIHNLSFRSKNPFIAINCGAIPDNLLESELFGYVKGAFTDAKQDRAGKLKAAHKGTLFLDEIGDLPKHLQVKILRVIQEKTYEPLGSDITRKTDIRLICATNRNLYQMVLDESFREDLYYRINVIPINIPSLKDRKDDLPLLIDHFIKIQNYNNNKNISDVSPEVMSTLMDYDFPGNIRELENIIERASILCHGNIIEACHLRNLGNIKTPFSAVPNNTNAQINSIPNPTISNISEIKDIEKDLILQTLRKNIGNRKKTANDLNISPVTLWRKIKKYNLL